MSGHDHTEWNDLLTTGIEEIDRQHRILFNTLHEVEARITEPMNPRRFEQITRDLLAYAIYHFETEEQLITHCGYDVADPNDARLHVQQHRGFSQRIVTLRKETHTSPMETQEALLRLLKDWLINHISISDQRLARFIRAKSVL